LTGEPRRLVQMQVAGKIEGQKNQHDRTHRDGVIAPVLAVRPDWKTSHKGNDDNYGENE